MPTIWSWLCAASIVAAAHATIPDVHQPGSEFKTATVTYDTWTVTGAAMSATTNYIASPCNDCIITSLSAALTYENGSRADLDTGVLLHHAVLLNLAKEDRQCAPWKERFFWSGNERTVWDLANDRQPGSRKDFGYHLDSPDGLLLVIELMNLYDEDQAVVFAMNWEWTDDPRIMQDMKRVTPYWLDVAKPCSFTSEVPNLENMHFQYTGQGVSVEGPGQVAVGYGHSHQGASNLTVSTGDRVICEFFVKHADESEGGHVKTVTHCADAGRVEDGDILSVTGNYDTDLHPARKQPDGSLEPTMGLVMLYLLESDDAPGVSHNFDHEEESQGSRMSLLSSPVSFGLAAVALLAVGYVCGFYWRGRRRTKDRRGSNTHGEESMELMKNREED